MASVQILNSTGKDLYKAFLKNKDKIDMGPTRQKIVDSIKSFDTFVKVENSSPAGRMMTKRGKFTELGKKELEKLFREWELPKTATWQDFFDLVIKQNPIRKKPVKPCYKSIG